MPAGRPTDYSEQTVDAICQRIAEGESLRTICFDNEMPALRTVFDWLAKEEHENFRIKYARARETQADTLFDEMLDIADDGSNDWMERHDAEGGNLGWRENGEALRRSQLRIETRKWMAAKLKPKKYGDKLDVEHAGNINLSFSSEDAKLL